MVVYSQLMSIKFRNQHEEISGSRRRLVRPFCVPVTGSRAFLCKLIEGLPNYKSMALQFLLTGHAGHPAMWIPNFYNFICQIMRSHNGVVVVVRWWLMVLVPCVVALIVNCHLGNCGFLKSWIRVLSPVEAKNVLNFPHFPSHQRN